MARFKRGRKRPWARFKRLRKRPTATVHPVFGEIEWDEDFEAWLGSVRIDAFSPYDVVASKRLSEQFGDYNHNHSLRDTHALGLFELFVVSEDGSPPTRSQEVAYLRFCEECEAVCESVVRAIFEYYRPMRDVFLTGDSARDSIAIPRLDSPEGLKDLIRLNRLRVLDSEGGEGFLGFAFACSWEIEHGLGVLTRSTEVVEVGENSITWTGPSS